MRYWMIFLMRQNLLLEEMFSQNDHSVDSHSVEQSDLREALSVIPSAKKNHPPMEIRP